MTKQTLRLSLDIDNHFATDGIRTAIDGIGTSVPQNSNEATSFPYANIANSFPRSSVGMQIASLQRRVTSINHHNAK